jgi:membrane-bound lytic murein transglycosylase F
LTRPRQLIIGCIALLIVTSIVAIIPKNKLELIQRAGTLRVLTRIDPTTYFQSPQGFSGLEYDLVMLFAKHIGVTVKFEVPDNFSKILSDISMGKADIVAAGLTVTQQRMLTMRFAPPYHEVTEQIVYRSDHRRPESINDLGRGILEVAKATSHVDSLTALKGNNPNLDWAVNDNIDTNGLLYLLHEGLIDYNTADSNQILLIRRFYPDLNIAFDISKPRQLAWALPLSEDSSLFEEVERFFQRITADKTLAQLIEKHYGHASSLNTVDNCTFREHKKNRLPQYQNYFDQAAKEHEIDWRLLAAIGYQESHWLDNAVSPTGVEGIMMLTNDTAKLLNIKNRRDPVESIKGGARYFKQRIKVMSDQIHEPDRTWFALASYNVGTGHLHDARIITQKLGGDPNKWMDVKKRLPLLSEPKWYEQTQYGQARGNEPVQYVENIRGYYDLLVWLTEENQIKKNAMETEKAPNFVEDNQTAEAAPTPLY